MDVETELKRLREENEELRAENENLRRRRLSGSRDERGVVLVEDAPCATDDYSTTALSIIVIGASGDLARKKTFPALFSLWCHGLLPESTVIAGYARSHKEHDDFITSISQSFKKSVPEQKRREFLSRCFYVSGEYESVEDWSKFESRLAAAEAKALPPSSKKTSPCGPADRVRANRIFYLAIPPNIFVQVGHGIQPAAMSKTGWNRVIVEKPFGRDSESSAKLGKQLAAVFAEDQLYRIDHYLGKEMVQNLMVLRFANKVFEPIWNSSHINVVMITFKEDFGTQGRGGYFDPFGIIRDVMQNHLTQILSLVAMEPPVSLSAEDIRDEKVKLLRAILPIDLADIVIGQYGRDADGKHPAYLEDKTVPAGSITPTFATACLRINNARWNGVPFILKCGKALDERKAEIRIQFKRPAAHLFTDTSPNELVLRIQPDEAVWLKMTTKKPGLQGGSVHTELNLSYRERFPEDATDLPDAYERLILDVVRGDHGLFVRNDELVAAWNIFTPILHRLEKEKIKPIIYPFGGRGPAESDELVQKTGYERTTGYRWYPPTPAHAPASASAAASLLSPVPVPVPALTLPATRKT